MYLMRSVGVAAILAYGAPVPAEAASAAFYQQCDGYGAPTQNGDGMTREATGLFGLFGPLGSAGNTRRITPSLGESGLSACDQALTDARLLDKHWLRRASLLRARAVHALVTGNIDRAASDLDLAEHAIKTPDDPYIKRSMGLGILLVRAYILRSQGDMAGASRLLDKIWIERRFNRQMSLAMLAVAHDEKTLVGGQPVLRTMATLSPRMLDILSENAFNHGDFSQVVILDSQLEEPLATLDVGIRRDEVEEQTLDNEKRVLISTMSRSGHLAYALAALGRVDAARAALTDGGKRLDTLIPARIPAPLADQSDGHKAMWARQANAVLIVVGEQSRHALSLWRDLVELRIAAATAPAKALADRFVKLSPPAGGAALDLLKVISAKLPNDPTISDAITKLDARLNGNTQGTPQELKILFEALPHTEIGQRVATYKKANSALVGYLWGGVSGFKTKVRPDGMTTVSFTGERSSASVVEELTLLRAADLAREQGKGGLVIHARRDYERTQSTTYYGAVLRSDPIGYSSEIDVEFVDLAALPERYKATPWRVIPVDEVIANLAPTYLAPT